MEKGGSTEEGVADMSPNLSHDSERVSKGEQRGFDYDRHAKKSRILVSTEIHIRYDKITKNHLANDFDKNVTRKGLLAKCHGCLRRSLLPGVVELGLILAPPEFFPVRKWELVNF